MRIIAGTVSFPPVEAPAGLATRPTSDRLRETLFNVLAPRIEGAVFWICMPVRERWGSRR